VEEVAWLSSEEGNSQKTMRAKSKDALIPSDFLDIHAYVQVLQSLIWDFAMYTMLLGVLGGIYYAGGFDT
jgi:hypothetical protein